MVSNCFENKYTALQILREIKLLRKLTEMKDNIFTTKVIDIILPETQKETAISDNKS